MYRSISHGRLHKIVRHQHTARHLNHHSLNELDGKDVKEDVNGGLSLGAPTVCKRWLVVHPPQKSCSLVNSVPAPLLPIVETPPNLNLNKG
jgi:hypothetical protein